MNLKRNKILVIGAADTGILEFVKGVFQADECGFPQELVDEELKKSNGLLSGVRIPWTIDNKYYTANVEFWLDEIHPETKQDMIKGYSKSENGIGKVVDAFVYVFSRDKPETFDAIKDWVPFLDEFGPAVQLCIGSKASDPQIQDLLPSAEEWCSEHEFEYIDLNEATSNPLDKGGFGLALDTLQAHFWDGMQMKNKVSEGGGPSFPTSVYDEDDDSLAGGIENLKLDGRQVNADILRLSDGDEDYDDLDLPTEAEIQSMQQQLFADIDSEDGLDKALAAMQSLREQGQKLPDDERRKLAAKVALSFAAQLGI